MEAVSSARLLTSFSIRALKDLALSSLSGFIGYPKVTVLLERLGRFLPFRKIFAVPDMCIGITGTSHLIAR